MLNVTPLSSESGSPPDDDLIHPAKRPRRGPAPRAINLWSHARSSLPHEPSRAPSGHRWFYCSRCDWKSIISNTRRHLASHGIHVGRDDSLQKQAAATSIEASLSAQELAAQTRSDGKTRETLRNVCNKGDFRNAVARFVTSQSLAHNVFESKEFHAMCLTLNYEAGYALIRSHSSIPHRIASNFEYQRSFVKEALHEAQSAIQLCTDSWTFGLTNHREFQAINAQWVDANGQIQRALLALPELTQGHAGEDVAPHVIDVLHRYDIKHKLGFVTADNPTANVTANDTLCRAIYCQLEPWMVLLGTRQPRGCHAFVPSRT
jgi:hypothetical protein